LEKPANAQISALVATVSDVIIVGAPNYAPVK
jgi:hypothetical protein